MFDKELVLDSLQKIKAMLDLILERASVVETPNDFLCSPSGMMRLDAICMNLIALGETVKGLDKLTAGELLLNYPEIFWILQKKCLYLQSISGEIRDTVM